MSPILLLSLVLVSAQALGGNSDSRTTQDTPRVLVDWTNPKEMSEARTYNPRGTTPQEWLIPLGQHLEHALERRLPEGQRMEVVITDVLRAGRFEPWQRQGLDEVRILRDTTPPRITLAYRHWDSQGHLLGQGQQRLVDNAYTFRSSLSSDPLRYEKRLLDDWVRKLLPQERHDQ